jgi:hypothetical protein
MKRTINLSDTLRHQLALIAAEWGCTSEEVIQSFLAAGIMTVAEHDRTIGLALMRAAGVSWDNLRSVANLENQEDLIP